MPSNFVRAIMRIIRNEDWSQSAKGKYMKKFMKAENRLDEIMNKEEPSVISFYITELPPKNDANIHTTRK